MSDITPITEWPEWSDDTRGGDPITQDLNALYDRGSMAFMLICTILCWLITPAIGFLYAGMHRRKSALIMIFQSLFLTAACGIQFWIYGYSLYQSRTSNPIIGNMDLAFFRNLLAQPSQANADIPDILYAAFGFTFVSATAMILAGAMLERGRLYPSLLFLMCWTTFVYYFLAHFEWNPSGWLYSLGLLDFAGSGPVHIATGFSALAWSMMLGPRISDTTVDERRKIIHYKPHNPLLMCIGTAFIWGLWFAFCGASTGNVSIRSVYIIVNTNLAACGGAVAWVGLGHIFDKKFSLLGLVSGIIAGLVGITPASGFVPVYTAALIGFLTSICSYFTFRYKYILSIDDGLDIFAIHGVGGYVGDVLTGVFAADWVPALDGVMGDTYAGGWWSGHWIQVPIQLAGATTCAAWSFVVTCILLYIINKIPGCTIREPEEVELQGLDAKYLDDVDAEKGWDDLFTGGGSTSSGASVDGVSHGVPQRMVTNQSASKAEKEDAVQPVKQA